MRLKMRLKDEDDEDDEDDENNNGDDVDDCVWKSGAESIQASHTSPPTGEWDEHHVDIRSPFRGGSC